MTVRYEVHGPVVTVTIERLEVRNAVDMPTAAALADFFRRFDSDATLSVAVLTGSGGHFCAGFDLKALAMDAPDRLSETGEGPMGPTRMMLSKPVIAAIEGYAVAGGLELALWCDLRVAANDATLGVFNRPVPAEEALRMGLVERLVEPGHALEKAQQLAHQIAAFPSGALRADRRSVLNQWSLSLDQAAEAESRGGIEVLRSGEAQEGASRFAKGAGRHGS